MGPWDLGRVIRHSVFWEAIVEDFEATFEFWTFSAPAGVLIVVAVGAEFGFECMACRCLVLVSTGAAGV